MTTPVEIQVKAPAWAPAQASGAGSGASPAHTIQNQKYVYTKEFRKCRKAEGRTKSIAYCPTCNSVIPPASTRRSKTGAHGEDIWVHEHPLVFATLVSSNSGRRSVVIEPGFPEELADAIRRSWVFFRYEPEEVERILTGEE